jgi:hypothetical protein
MPQGATSGYVLTAQGAGTAPVWASTPAGYITSVSSPLAVASGVLSLTQTSLSVAHTQINDWATATSGFLTSLASVSENIVPSADNTYHLGLTYGAGHAWNSVSAYYVETDHIIPRTAAYTSTNALLPATANTYVCGNNTSYWASISAYTVYYHALSAALDALDDLGIITNYKTKKAMHPKTNEEIDVIDLDSIPEIRSDAEDGADFIDGSKVLHLTLGALKQVGAKIAALEKEIKLLKPK